jgi:tetratricopeptide (TPR) repeat protein
MRRIQEGRQSAVSGFGRRLAVTFAIGSAVAAVGCAGSRDGETLASLHAREPDLTEAKIDDGLRQAMAGYQAFLDEAPTSALTPEAMRRLADLKLEKEFGLRGASRPPAETAGSSASTTSAASAPTALPRPSSPAAIPESSTRGSAPAALLPLAGETESDRDFETRATVAVLPESGKRSGEEEWALPGDTVAPSEGPLEAIELYDRILATYPDYAYTDQVLYQKARAFDELGRTDEAIAVAHELTTRFPNSRHVAEIQFRRGEYFFTRKRFIEAEEAYAAIARLGSGSGYFELALYKLGWTFYKQMLLEESLESFARLLDQKVETGYDFDQVDDDTEAQRIADTYRVMSLCFSELGGAESITAFFASHGPRSYEHRVYRQMGEFYLEKLRYADAAGAYAAFVDLHPFHAQSPRFSMRIVEIYEVGGFPKLVLEAKKEFAASYGLRSAYWTHFDVEAMPEVVAFLKSNLEDLANHYHALYQNPDAPEDRPAHFAESSKWYRAYLEAFPADPETPGIHYRLADLQLENQDFAEAAAEYERIAYDYAPHERAASAGYAAIFAHREREKQVVALASREADERAAEEARNAVKRAAITSTLRFVDGFPDHEHAATVFGAAVDDLYTLGEHTRAIENGRRLVSEYEDSDPKTRRAAWLVIAHASFDTEAFVDAETGYGRVLELTPPEDESRVAIVNNLAASIYKQGERARAAGDHREAADQFLRIATVAPDSEIRPVAAYDAGAALVALEDWGAAATVFEAFRETFPQHELASEATRQIALVYRSDEQPARAAEEYERVANEADEPTLRSESLLVASQLYQEAEQPEQAISVLETFTREFPTPLEPAIAARFELAELHGEIGASDARKAELRTIVDLDRRAGAERSDVVRVLAARAALALAEDQYAGFTGIRLTLPFEHSLEQKKKSMRQALDSMGRLIDYEVGEVTAAATFYMAEIYDDFSRSLLESERPADLTEDELLQYELVLEEEAYPFEEKAIVVHEKNLELMSSGVFNRWIEKSIGELAVAMPGRYAKFESSTGLLTSPRSYSYVAPSAPAPPLPESIAAVPAEPGEEDAVATSYEDVTDDSATASTEAPEEDTVAAATEAMGDEPVSDTTEAMVDETVSDTTEATEDATMTVSSEEPVEETVTASAEESVEETATVSTEAVVDAPATSSLEAPTDQAATTAATESSKDETAATPDEALATEATTAGTEVDEPESESSPTRPAEEMTPFPAAPAASDPEAGQPEPDALHEESPDHVEP